MAPPVSREMRRSMKRKAAKRPQSLRRLPDEEWRSKKKVPKKLAEVWISKDYLVQVFNEDKGIARLSICRTTVFPDGNWIDGLSWEDLQDIKRQVGRGDQCAVEVFPCEEDVVNVANMRHLWIFPKGLVFGWSDRLGAAQEPARDSIIDVTAVTMA